ncbi:MAG: hypothetical protein OEV94_02705 [Deltaproteobacteria bacterium]|nr:hypothetical protein [Deltaproteobacteria bacterium]
MKKIILGMLLLGLLAAGVAFPAGVSYGPYNGTSGFQDIHVDGNVFIITFTTPVTGNGRFKVYINPEPYNFYRCAQLTQERGYASFVVESTYSTITDNYYTVSRTIHVSKAAKDMNNVMSFDASMVLQTMSGRVAGNP